MTTKEAMLKCDKDMLIETTVNYLDLYCMALHENNLKGLLMIRKKSKVLQGAIKERNLVDDYLFWEKIFSRLSDLINLYDNSDNFAMGDLLMDIIGRMKSEVGYDD